MISKVSEKAFFSKDIQYINVFRRNDMRTIYNIVYRDGRNGSIMIKRFFVNGITRDKEYDATRGTDGSQLLYFSANPNGEAEVLKVYFKPRPRMKKLIEELDFAALAVKGRSSQGNIFARTAIHKILVKEKGVSTLGGLKVWLDTVTSKLNTEERGTYLGEFSGDDKILVVTRQGTFYTTSYELVNRYEDDILLIKKFDAKEVFSVVYFDGDQKYHYIKRFRFETANSAEKFIDEHPSSNLLALSQDTFPQLEIVFGGKNAKREPEHIDVEEFIAVKSHRAKGKRLTSYEVKVVRFIEPLEKEVAVEEHTAPSDGGANEEAKQMSLL